MSMPYLEVEAANQHNFSPYFVVHTYKDSSRQRVEHAFAWLIQLR